MKEFIECREIAERIKDIMSKDVEGFVFDYMVADELGIPYSTFRFAITKNKPPVKEIALFCYKRKLIINDIIF